MATENADEFTLEFFQDKESIVKYLNALEEGFRKGHLILGSKKKQILFQPRGLIKFKIKAKRRNSANKITLKFSWEEDDVDHSSEKLLVLKEEKDNA